MPKSLHRALAFTLLEMLVALAVLTIIVTLLAVVYQQIDRVTTSSAARQESDQTARIIFNSLSRELQQTERSFGPPRTVAFYGLQSDQATNSPTQPFLIRASSASLAASTNLISGPSAYWPTTIGGENGESTAMLGYFVRWIQENQRIRPALCRFYLSETNSQFVSIQNTNTNAWLTPALLDQFAPANEASEFRGLFAENVLAIWMRALDREGNPITQAPRIVNAAMSTTTTPLNGDFDSTLGLQYVSGTQTNKVLPWATPASVEIALVIGESRILKNNTNAYSVPSNLVTNPATFWANINTYVSQVQTNNPRLGKSLRVYSTRVNLPEGSR